MENAAQPEEEQITQETLLKYERMKQINQIFVNKKSSINESEADYNVCLMKVIKNIFKDVQVLEFIPKSLWNEVYLKRFLD